VHSGLAFTFMRMDSATSDFSLIAASAFRYDGDLATQDGVGHDYFPA
jgi:hypothetical protein